MCMSSINCFQKKIFSQLVYSLEFLCYCVTGRLYSVLAFEVTLISNF